ncbi:hypothetical protein Aph01nite_64940 [Acrocarpospora phusangensis]|uniref:Uncharacterized protein n=1 Tax=Acrocarpospora phusangensis TaxID=1070424 RepID=A0A919QFG7_9ACTN|nr:hypothetical protein Aph01nite_64940 [Acrocarpospora phusangensis]
MAETAPAVANEPVMECTSSVMPMPSMEMGIRPTNPATTNDLAPGMLNSPRYGPTMTEPLSRALGTM